MPLIDAAEVLRHVVPQLPVGKRFHALVCDEDPIHVVAVQAVAAMLQLIVVYHTDVRVQHRHDIAGVVVDTVDFKYLLHSFSPFMEHETQSYKNSESVQVSTKFTPQLAEMYGNSVEKMAEASMERMGIDTRGDWEHTME